MSNPVWQQLSRGAEKFGIELSESQLVCFDLYLHELIRWNRSCNLTRITKPEAVLQAHFLDSFNYLPGLEGATRVLDLGSGPGFPGLPLALVQPQTTFVLCEARSRKVLFLEHLRTLLKLENVAIEHLHLGRQNATTAGLGKFPVMVCRAVNLLRDVVPVAAQLLTPGGRLLFTDAHPEEPRIVRELARKTPGLRLESLVPCRCLGRAPQLFLGSIRRVDGLEDGQ